MADVAEQAALDAAIRVVSRDDNPVSYRSFFSGSVRGGFFDIYRVFPSDAAAARMPGKRESGKERMNFE